MLLSLLYAAVRVALRLLIGRTGPVQERELEILLLRHQLPVLQRAAARPRLRRRDRIVLAALTQRLPRPALCSLLLVSPDTVLRWHRELVRRKWAAYARRRRPGRRPIPDDVRALICRMATDNPSWGYLRIKGELRKLGVPVSAATIRRILRRHRVHQRQSAIAQRGRRSSAAMRDRLSPVTSSPWTRCCSAASTSSSSSNWRRAASSSPAAPHIPTPPGFTQQARHLSWQLDDLDDRPMILIRDRDAKFTTAFDTIFSSAGVCVFRRNPISRFGRIRSAISEFSITLREDPAAA